ncbi:MAG: TRAP transporter small permease [Spirochaetaceae bacterium]|jgi:TRAP-type C4-dicarboxylate transport system permease small subunit|nr:TRAP transporter small permease [Spirochaetaceae bacterium]
MKKIIRFLDEHLEEIFISLAMGYFVTVTILQILFRFVLKMPASWTEETAKYAFIWMTFVGSSLGAKIHGHIRVDMFENALRGRTRLLVNWLNQLIFLVFSVIMTVVGIRMCVSLLSRPQLSPALKIPMQWIYAALPVGMGLMVVRIALNLVFQIKAAVSGKGEVQP